jgi:hypothetical protein
MSFLQPASLDAYCATHEVQYRKVTAQSGHGAATLMRSM